MQIDGDVEAPAPQPRGQRDVVEETLRAPRRLGATITSSRCGFP